MEKVSQGPPFHNYKITHVFNKTYNFNMTYFNKHLTSVPPFGCTIDKLLILTQVLRTTMLPLNAVRKHTDTHTENMSELIFGTVENYFMCSQF